MSAIVLNRVGPAGALATAQGDPWADGGSTETVMHNRCMAGSNLAWRCRYACRTDDGAAANSQKEGPYIRIYPLIFGSGAVPEGGAPQDVISQKWSDSRAQGISGLTVASPAAAGTIVPGSANSIPAGANSAEWYYELDAGNGGQVYLPFPCTVKVVTAVCGTWVYETVAWADRGEKYSGPARPARKWAQTRSVLNAATRNIQIPNGARRFQYVSTANPATLQLIYQGAPNGVGASGTVDLPLAVAGGALPLPVGGANLLRVVAGAADALIQFEVEF